MKKKNRTTNNEKNPPYSHKTKFQKNKQETPNSKQDSNFSKTTHSSIDVNPSNPYCKEIDRHFGSFKTKILGNYLKIFNSLDFTPLSSLGKHGTGARRKLLRRPGFSAVFWSNGTVIINPTRKKSVSKQAPEELQADFFNKGSKAASLIECFGLSLAPLKMNQLPKYGVEDLTARTVRKEVTGKFRKIDSSTRIVRGKVVHKVPHVDNFGAAATKRDCQFDSNFLFKVSQERVVIPEYFSRIEDKVDKALDVSLRFSKNIELHLDVETRTLETMKKFNHLLSSPRAFRNSFKKSATVRGCN